MKETESGLDALLAGLSQEQKDALLRKLQNDPEISGSGDMPAAYKVPYLPMLRGFQEKLHETLYLKGYKDADLVAPLQYGHRSSVSRLFRRTGMPISDVVKIMAFAGIPSVTAASLDGGVSFTIKTNAKTPTEAAEAVAALDKTDPRPKGLTWEQISRDMGYSSRTGARLDRREETQVVWFIQFALLYGVRQFEAKTASGVFLQIQVV